VSSVITILDEDRIADLPAEPAGDALWVTPSNLASSLGWELKPEGLCRGALCTPIPAERRRDLTRDDGSIDLAALARLRGQPIVHDDARTIWVLGRAPETAGALRDSLVAPDFSLPDLDGRMHSLSDARGRKVLLASWASW
jgi:hypothetical protein